MPPKKQRVKALIPIVVKPEQAVAGWSKPSLDLTMHHRFSHENKYDKIPKHLDSTLAFLCQSFDNLFREVGYGRVPRQPGQIRKEAALTSLMRVIGPASHLMRVTDKWAPVIG